MMCYSNATVFYGLFVRTSDLVDAGNAWMRIRPTFLALHMISARRSGGRLKMGGRVRLNDVPQEVWGLVKDELIDAELQQASQDLARHFHCGRCTRDETVPDFRDLFDCELCCDVFLGRGGLREIVQFGAKPIASLLREHGLYQPDDRILVAEEPYWHNEDASSAVAYYPSASRKLPPSASPESHEEMHGHEIVPFDPSIFLFPPKAANRILSFCRLFRLEIVAAPAASHPDANPAAQQDSIAPTTTEKTVEPRWQLWATSECGP